MHFANRVALEKKKYFHFFLRRLVVGLSQRRSGFQAGQKFGVVSIFSRMLNTHFHLNIILIKGISGKSLENFELKSPLSNTEHQWTL
jgi:hypothetical protein